MVICEMIAAVTIIPLEITALSKVLLQEGIDSPTTDDAVAEPARSAEEIRELKEEVARLEGELACSRAREAALQNVINKST